MLTVDESIIELRKHLKNYQMLLRITQVLLF